MNVLVREDNIGQSPPVSKIGVADADIHPNVRSDADLHPFMTRRWIEHLQQFGKRPRHGWQVGTPYPKSQPGANRRDAIPPEGGRPGSSLSFMQAQHLNTNNVELGILNAIGNGQGIQNPGLCAALASAVNDWQIAEWTSRDDRLKASIVVPYEDGPAAADEIRRRAGDPNYVQVLLLTRTAEPLGALRYWPIYEAAVEAGLPVGIHAFGFGGSPVTGGGWPSFYMEEMVSHAQSAQAVLTSLVISGVFARFPALRVMMIETGFAWVPSLAWRLDRVFARLRAETPELNRLPSEYIRDHVWWTTQPMEEPEPREHLLDTIEWIGWDRLLFATDYPHWDFDDPATCLPLQISTEQRRQFFLGNARAFYGVH